MKEVNMWVEVLPKETEDVGVMISFASDSLIRM